MLSLDTRKLDVQIGKFIKLAKGRTAAFSAIFIQDLSREVVMNTPVITGFLRASWWASIGTPPSLTANTPDKTGSTTVSRVNLVVATMKPGQIYYFVNGANYAMHVEYGTVRMAPRRMVGRALDRANAIAKAAAIKAGNLSP